MVETWKIDENYIGQYAKDYKYILQSDVRTVNEDKYGAMLRDASLMVTMMVTFPFDGNNGKTLQPISYYIRWIHSGELHFLSYEKN